MSLKLIFEIDWLKTLRFNLHYFPLKQAVKIPAYVFRKTSFVDLGGYFVEMSGEDWTY